MNGSESIGRWKEKARQLQVDLYALLLAYKNPRVPWYTKIFAACVVGYAFSPIDLIPDFIPVLGQLDDLILIPVGIAIALKMIQKEVWEESRKNAREILEQGRPRNWIAGGIIIVIWLCVIAFVAARVVKGGSR